MSKEVFERFERILQRLHAIEEKLDGVVASSDPPDLDGDAHELWALAQLTPGEGISDGVDRIKKFLRRCYKPIHS